MQICLCGLYVPPLPLSPPCTESSVFRPVTYRSGAPRPDMSAMCKVFITVPDSLYCTPALSSPSSCGQPSCDQCDLNHAICSQVDCRRSRDLGLKKKKVLDSAFLQHVTRHPLRPPLSHHAYCSSAFRCCCCCCRRSCLHKRITVVVFFTCCAGFFSFSKGGHKYVDLVTHTLTCAEAGEWEFVL